MRDAPAPRLRLGIIGCGRVVERFHLPALTRSSDWAVAAVSDVDPDRRRWLGQSLAYVPVFDAYERMLDQVELDAALVATHPASQTAIATSALSRGLPTMVEKPGGASYAEARAMAEAAERSGAALRINYNRRFMPNYQTLGAILNRLKRGTVVRGSYTLSFDPEGWDPIEDRMAWGSGGSGVLLDVAPHQIDTLGWLAGRRVREIRISDWSRGDGQELLQYTVELEDGWSVDCRAWHGPGYQEHMDLEWDAGGAVLYPTGVLGHGRLGESTRTAVVRARHWVQRKLIRLGLSQDVIVRSFVLQWAAFARAIGGAPETVGSDSMSALNVHAGLQSIREGWKMGDRLDRKPT